MRDVPGNPYAETEIDVCVGGSGWGAEEPDNFISS